MFIDMHTHSIRADHSVKGLFNAPPVSRPDDLPDHWLVSTGVHPWLCDKANFARNCQNLQVAAPASCLSLDEYPDHARTTHYWLDTLARLAAKHQIDAIGEVGLDRARGGSLSAQTDLFEAQIQIAEQHKLPLVIHCVRAFPELLTLRKRFQQTPWIIHAFRGNLQIAMQLIDHNCHLSFDVMLLRSSKLQKVARAITPKAIFLETDQSQTSIEDLYHATATILSLDTAELQEQIRNHFAEEFFC